MATKKKLKKYTVVLAYPDYLSESCETYIAWVKARTVEEGVQRAQRQAVRAQEFDPEDDPINPIDFDPIVMYNGWLKSHR
jgi:hypothetical protein